MKHEKKKVTIGEDKKDSFFRSVVKNGDSKHLALKPILKDWTFVEIEILKQNENDVTIKISKVRNED